jgi:hypothetical protein
VVMELEIQGAVDNVDALREHVMVQSTPLAIDVMFGGGEEIESLHSVGVYTSPPTRKFRYNLKLMGAIGNRDGEQDVAWFIISPSDFGWTNITVCKIQKD